MVPSGDAIVKAFGIDDLNDQVAVCSNCYSDGKLYSVKRRCSVCKFLCCPICMPKKICRQCQRNMKNK